MILINCIILELTCCASCKWSSCYYNCIKSCFRAKVIVIIYSVIIVIVVACISCTISIEVFLTCIWSELAVVIFIKDAITTGNQAVYDVFTEFIFPRLGLVRTTDWFLEKLKG